MAKVLAIPLFFGRRPWPRGSLFFRSDREVSSKGWGSAGIGAEKPLFSVLVAWGVFVYQVVVMFAVTFKAWRPLLGSMQSDWLRTSFN